MVKRCLDKILPNVVGALQRQGQQDAPLARTKEPTRMDGMDQLALQDKEPKDQCGRILQSD